jgi:hypothetical protein
MIKTLHLVAACLTSIEHSRVQQTLGNRQSRGGF